jgi:hypothetical protein
MNWLRKLFSKKKRETKVKSSGIYGTYGGTDKTKTYSDNDLLNPLNPISPLNPFFLHGDTSEVDRDSQNKDVHHSSNYESNLDHNDYGIRDSGISWSSSDSSSYDSGSYDSGSSFDSSSSSFD